MKVLLILLIVFISMSVRSEDRTDSKLSVALKVNILKPVCRLELDSELIDFDEFDILDLMTSPPRRVKELMFKECNLVKGVAISFTGSNIDYDVNMIKNQTGDGYAQGIGVQLYDENETPIDLSRSLDVRANIPAAENSFSYTLISYVKRISEPQKVTPGILDTNVGIKIVYN